MKEKQIQSLFGKKIDQVGVYELKLCKGKSLPFDSVADHQIEALVKVKSGVGKYHKISDSFIADRIRGTRFPTKKPFDCFFLKDFPAYVAVLFYEPRKTKLVYCIDIDAWLHEKINAARKSLTLDRAIEISSFNIKV